MRKSKTSRRCMRRVVTVVRMRATKVEPALLWVPKLRLRQSTARRRERSARLLVGSMSSTVTKVHSASSALRRLWQVCRVCGCSSPAPSNRSWWTVVQPRPLVLLPPASFVNVDCWLLLDVHLRCFYWFGQRLTDRRLYRRNAPNGHLNVIKGCHPFSDIPLTQAHSPAEVPNDRLHPWPEAARRHFGGPFRRCYRSARNATQTVAPILGDFRFHAWYFRHLAPFGIRVVAQQQGAAPATTRWSCINDRGDFLTCLQQTRMTFMAWLSTTPPCRRCFRRTYSLVWPIRRWRFRRVLRILVHSLFQLPDSLTQLFIHLHQRQH